MFKPKTCVRPVAVAVLTPKGLSTLWGHRCQISQLSRLIPEDAPRYLSSGSLPGAPGHHLCARCSLERSSRLFPEVWLREFLETVIVLIVLCGALLITCFSCLFTC